MNSFFALGELLAAERCVASRCRRHGNEHDLRELGPGYLPHLRALIRTGLTLPPTELVDRVGRSSREDQLVSLLLASHGTDAAGTLTEALRNRLVTADRDSSRTAALLDLATGQSVAPLAPTEVASFVRAGGTAVRRAALRHLAVLPPTAEEDTLLALAKMLKEPCDLVTWSVAVLARGHAEATILRCVPASRRGLMRLLPRAVCHERPGKLLMQLFAMTGALSKPGAGDSGGLAVFLSSLGNALAGQEGISCVLTVVQADAADLADRQAWTQPLSEGHLVLGIPVLRPLDDYGEPLAEIRWWLQYLMPALDLVPDVAHLRFGSDVTLSVASAMRALGSRTVFTIAPDPHRMILESHIDSSGDLNRRGLAEDLHRMFAADLLSDWADSAIALPGIRQEEETSRYFPSAVRRLGSVEAIPEGISRWRASAGDAAAGRKLVARLFEQHGWSGLTENAAGLRVLLNVGRWNPVKQQDVIVEAWLRAGLARCTVLVLVGGDQQQPTRTESTMRERVAEMLSATQTARGRFAWLPRLSNRDVRLLERAVSSELPASGPHVYVCGSVKEEFGIAVLEAMEAGLLAIAPHHGGAGHYIRPGVTGFLADTSSSGALAIDLAAILGPARTASDLSLIAAAGRRRVRDEFGIDSSAGRFARHYRRLLDCDQELSA